MNLIDYETDFYGWTQQQAQLLRNKQIEQIDWNYLAEEIEAMGRSEKRQLESRLEVLIMHLLKWEIYPLAVISAEKETGLSLFPEICPYDLNQIFSSQFLP